MRVIPCSHDTTGCQKRLNNRLNVCLHEAAGCSTAVQRQNALLITGIGLFDYRIRIRFTMNLNPKYESDTPTDLKSFDLPSEFEPRFTVNLIRIR